MVAMPYTAKAHAAPAMAMSKIHYLENCGDIFCLLRMFSLIVQYLTRKIRHQVVLGKE